MRLKSSYTDKPALWYLQKICINFFYLVIRNISCKIFDVLLTMQLSIILVINQLNVQIIVSFNKFIIFLYMFRSLLCSSSGGQIVLYSIWYRHTLQVAVVPDGQLRGRTIKFANSPPCAGRGSTEQKP